MVAIELVKPGDGDGRTPDPDLTKRIQAEALARNLIVLTAGTYVNVIRIIPPLVTTADEVDLALGILDESLAAAGRKATAAALVSSMLAPPARSGLGPGQGLPSVRGHAPARAETVQIDLAVQLIGVQASYLLVRAAETPIGLRYGADMKATDHESRDPGLAAARVRVAAVLEDATSCVNLGVVVVAPPDATRMAARDVAMSAATAAGRGRLLDEAAEAARDIVLECIRAMPASAAPGQRPRCRCPSRVRSIAWLRSRHSRRRRSPRSSRTSSTRRRSTSCDRRGTNSSACKRDPDRPVAGLGRVAGGWRRPRPHPSRDLGGGRPRLFRRGIRLRVGQRPDHRVLRGRDRRGARATRVATRPLTDRPDRPSAPQASPSTASNRNPISTVTAWA